MRELEQEVIGWRREIHTNPELSFKEYKTTEFIKNILQGFKNYEITSLAQTGVVATIKAQKPTKETIAFRADIDALALEENSGLSFASKTDGIMHACGHDGHTAILLGLAKLISKEVKYLQKNVKLIFQRGEEIAPGGAKELVELGVMEDVRMIFALHLMPGRKSKTISIKHGIASANKDTFDIFVYGKGGHSSAPQNCIDPILIASSIVLNMQSIISRGVNPFDSGVVSLASFHSGSKYGVIPNSAHLTGAIRSFDSKTRQIIKEKMTKIVENSALAYGGDSKIEFASWDYSGIYNDEKICQKLERIVCDKIGKEYLIRDTLPQSFSEDFSEYLQKAPGCMVWLGVGEDAPKLHSPNFNPDESSFIVGVKFFYEIVKEFAYV